jgi:hypothetical protein
VHAKVSSNSKINTDYASMHLVVWSLTNSDCNAENVAHVYKALWAVEDIFRTTKSILQTAHLSQAR